MAVARARSWCALGVAVTAAAKAGSDGADSGSGHGGDGGWKAQGTAAVELGASGLHWEGKECEVEIWTPPQVYIGLFVATEKSPCQFSLFLANFGLLAFLKSKNFKLINNII